MRSHLLGIIALCLGMLGQTAGAQQATIPIRPLGAIVATSAESLGTFRSIRALSDGRVLVNDPAKRRMLLLDSTLQRAVVIADTTSRTAKAYGNGLIGMVSFAGDSSLVLDQITGAFLIIDPTGKIARIIPAPAGKRPVFDRLAFDPLGVDQAGHLLFREQLPTFLSLLPRDFIGDTLMKGPDSAAILREDLATRRFDTIAVLQAPRVRQAVTRRDNGLGVRGSGRAAFNPIPSGDDWTLLSDGTIAVIRVRDYHIDWIRPDKRVTSSPTIPAERVRLTDSMKVAIMHSLRAADSAFTGDSGDNTPGAPRIRFVEPSDLPDYRPPFAPGSARADADGNVWVRANQALPAAGGAVYDIINRNGTLVDRIQIPAGTTLVALGPGVAYLTSSVGEITHLAKARIH